jgi:hypothetical protein
MLNSPPDLGVFYRWQKPRALWGLATGIASALSDEQFLSRGRHYEQKLQEALVDSTWCLCFSKLVSPVLIRMADSQLLDFEIRLASGEIWQLEVTTAHPFGYKIREEYRHGKKPSMQPRAFSGDPVSPTWLTSVIGNKTKKVIGKYTNRHLVVYQNISGGATDLGQVRKLVPNIEASWRSVWIITGIPSCGGIVLICKAASFGCPEMKWFSYATSGVVAADLMLMQQNNLSCWV